jgi:hypothetical protein
MEITMKRLCLSAVIELPTDLFDATEIIASVKTPWYAALQNLKNAGVKFEHSQEVMEARAKAPRKRKNKQDTVRLVETPPDEAA